MPTRGEGARRRRLGAGVEVDHRAGEAAGHRVAARDRGGDVGRAEADQFLVGIDALAPLGGERLGDRDRLRRSRSPRSAAPAPASAGHSPRSNARQRRAAAGRCGIVADDRRRPAGRGRAPRPRSVATTTATTGPVLATMSAARGFRPDCTRSGLSPLRTQNRNAVARRTPIASVGRFVVAEVRAERRAAARACVCPSALMPRIALTWLGRDEDARGGDEARDHRVRQEVRDEAEPEHAHHHEHQARQEGERDRGGGVLGGARRARACRPRPPSSARPPPPARPPARG